MPFDTKLAERVRKVLKGKRGISEKKMFGGLCFLLHGNMLCGVEKKRLVVRVGPEGYERALKRSHTKPMDFTGRPLKGFVYVSEAGVKTPSALKSWVGLSADFVQSLPRKSK